VVIGGGWIIKQVCVHIRRGVWKVEGIPHLGWGEGEGEVGEKSKKQEVREI